MATFYHALAQEKLVSRELMDLCRTSQGGMATDVVLGPRVADHGWGLGYMLNQRCVAGPNPRIFGHGGSGGSYAFVDLEHRIGYAYVMNRFDATKANADPRSVALSDEIYAALDVTSASRLTLCRADRTVPVDRTCRGAAGGAGGRGLRVRRRRIGPDRRHARDRRRSSRQRSPRRNAHCRLRFHQRRGDRAVGPVDQTVATAAGLRPDTGVPDGVASAVRAGSRARDARGQSGVVRGHPRLDVGDRRADRCAPRPLDSRRPGDHRRLRRDVGGTGRGQPAHRRR